MTKIKVSSVALLLAFAFISPSCSRSSDSVSDIISEKEANPFRISKNLNKKVSKSVAKFIEKSRSATSVSSRLAEFELENFNNEELSMISYMRMLISRL